MAKESKYGVLPNPVFREPFLDESSLRTNGGTPVLCTFLNGNIVLNGASSYATYPTVYKGVYSLRFKFSTITPSGVQYIFDGRASSGTGYLRMDDATTVSASSGTLYVNGAASATVSTATKEIIVTGITLATTLDYIGRINSSAANYLNASIDLFEVYSGTLTSNDVANIYSNRRNVNLSPYRSGITEILNVDGRRGTIFNKYGTAIVNTAVTSVRSGRVNAMSFNGASSGGPKLNCGSYDTLIGDKTFIAWAKPMSLGGSNYGTIINNGRLKFYIPGANRIILESANSTAAFSAVNSLLFGRWYLIVATRTSVGTTNIYINGVLSGNANQSSDVPVAGVTNITIGNNDAGTGTWNSKLSQVRILNGILTAQEVNQIWTSEKAQFFL